MNPLNWPGPQFLQFFAVLFLSTLIICLVIRAVIRRSSGGLGHRVDVLNELEIAMLAGGRPRAMHTAILSMIESGSVDLGPNGLLRAKAPQPSTASLLARHAFKSISATGTLTIRQASRKCESILEGMEDRLCNMGLLVPRSAGRLAAALSGWFMLMVFAIGAAKIYVGLSRNRPVGFLVVGCIVTFIVALVMFFMVPRRTPSGDDIVKKEKSEFDRASAKRPNASTDELLLGMALFGPMLLASTPYADLRNHFRETSPSSGYSGFSCGGSSCGGGGSCGGGSGCGGGGGCGGCGGS